MADVRSPRRWASGSRGSRPPSRSSSPAFTKRSLAIAGCHPHSPDATGDRPMPRAFAGCHRLLAKSPWHSPEATGFCRMPLAFGQITRAFRRMPRAFGQITRAFAGCHRLLAKSRGLFAEATGIRQQPRAFADCHGHSPEATGIRRMPPAAGHCAFRQTVGRRRDRR